MRQFPLSLVLLAAAVVAVLALGRGPAESAFPGANGKIAFVSGRNGWSQVYVMNADGSGQTNLTKEADGRGPAWSPDGGKIAFSSWRGGDEEIYVMNADGAYPTPLTNNGADDWGPAWSPDGGKIAFTSDRDNIGSYLYEVYVMNADGSGQTNLTKGAHGWGPAWSPDGSKIAFTSDRDGDNEVYVMNADGTGWTNLTNNSADDGWPDWSPDGSKIAFGSDRDNIGSYMYDVYVMNADGSGQTNVSNDPVSAEAPRWSPDGTKIAFHSWRMPLVQVYVMNADGSGQTNVTNRSGGWAHDYDAWPSWQPAAGSSSQDMPVGSNVSAQMDGVTMTCSQVTSAGKATLTTTKGGPAPPDEYGIIPGAQGDMLYYNISTTADCKPPITLCFTYDDTNLPCAESALKLAKRVGSDWVYLANQTIDTVNNIICGEVDSLSLFLMLGPVPVGVGGMVELRVGGEAPAAASGSASGGDHTLPAAAAAAGAVVVLGAGGWYARRRWVR